jgi:preprotein translocase subunit SecA
MVSAGGGGGAIDMQPSSGGPGPGYPVVGAGPQIAPGIDKVGRNDPCPCGSGKKYKKCHGA